MGSGGSAGGDTGGTSGLGTGGAASGGRGGGTTGGGGTIATGGVGNTGSGGTAGVGTGTGGGAGSGAGAAGGSTTVAAPLVLDVSTASNPVVAGGRLLYTITVGNVSARAVDGVTVLMRVPTLAQFNRITDAEPDLTSCNCIPDSEARWTLGTLAAGATQTMVVNAQILATAAAGDIVSAPVTLSATGVNPVAVTKSVQVFPAPSAQLALGTVSNPVTPNQTLVLDLDVGQIGAAALTGVELRASLPAGLTAGAISDGGTQATPGEIVWAIGGMAVGAALHRTVAVTVDGTVAPGTILSPRAALNYDGGAAPDASAEYPISILGAEAPLKINVTTTPNPVVPGGRVLYTATVSNVATRAIDGVTVQLRMPAGLSANRITDMEPDIVSCNCVADSEATWSLGSLAAGASQIITVNALAANTVVGDGRLIPARFIATATGVNPVLVAKTVPAFSRAGAQLALGTVTNPVTPNQAFTFDLDVGQIAATPLAGTELRASLPPGLTAGAISDGGTQPTPGQIVWTIGGIPVGGAVHRTLGVMVDGTVVAGALLNARATLSYDGGAEVDAAADYGVAVVAAALPLTVGIMVSPNPAVPGGRVLYTTTITNSSARAIDAVTLQLRTPGSLSFNRITDAEPDIVSCGCVPDSEATWPLGTLAAGASQIVTVNALLPATVLEGTLITASSHLSATGLGAIADVRTTVPTHR